MLKKTLILFASLMALNVNANSEVYEIYSDHLNTPRLLTNEQGNTIWENSPLTEPFGAGIVNEDPKNTGKKVTFNLRFPGQYYDKGTQSHYNYYRDNYIPSLGRYGQSDPIGLDGGVNTYGYVAGSPMRYVDPEGLAYCIYDISDKRLTCFPDDPSRPELSFPVASGNNGIGKPGTPDYGTPMQCKNNPECVDRKYRGPIPPGHWKWNNASHNKPNGKRLHSVGGTPTYGRGSFLTHSCINAFGPSTNAPYCSEGCITGSASDMQKLKDLLQAEPDSDLWVRR